MKKLIYLILATVLIYSCESGTNKARQQQVADSIATVNAERAAEQERIELEKQRIADSTAKANHELEVKNSIKITNYYLTHPNSAGGVSVDFRYTNLNDKVIKYLIWEGYPINGVGDPVSCTIRNNSTYKGQNTGPIKKGQSNIGQHHWECAWYNNQAKKLILTGVEIEYMDGSTLEIKGDDLYLIGKKKE